MAQQEFDKHANLERQAEILKVLGHPIRLKIVAGERGGHQPKAADGIAPPRDEGTGQPPALARSGTLQFTQHIGARCRGPCSWIARAITSLPVPVSP